MSNPTPQIPQTLNGGRVIGYIQTEMQSSGPCGIILVDMHGDGTGYVIAWYRAGDTQWIGGHYIQSEAAAYADFFARAHKETRHIVTMGIR